MSDQHVVQRDEGWAVRKEGAERDTSLHPTQKEAIDAATETQKIKKPKYSFTTGTEKSASATRLEMILIRRQADEFKCG